MATRAPGDFSLRPDPSGGHAASDWPAVPVEGIPEDGVAVLFLSSDPDAVMPETGEAS